MGARQPLPSKSWSSSGRAPKPSPSDTVSRVLETLRQRSHKPGAWAGAIAVTATLLLSGCSGVPGSAGDQPQQPAPSASSSAVATTPAPAATDPATSGAGATESGAPNESPSDLGDPAATRNGTADDQKAKLVVYPVRRSDTLATMHFTLTVDPAADDGIFVLDLFGDGDPTTGDSQSATLPWTAFASWTMPAASSISRPATAKATVCVPAVCKGIWSRGHTYTFYATYAAPPRKVPRSMFPSHNSVRSHVSLSSSRRAAATGAQHTRSAWRPNSRCW